MAYPVTLNGRTYTLADFEGTNYVEGLPDAFEDFVTHAGDIYNSTSTTSNSIGTGSKTFTVESAKPYQAGTPLRIADAAAPSTNFMDCIVTSYSGTTLVVDAVGYAGSGTFTSWNVNIGGAASVAGTVAIAQGGTGATTAAAARTNLDVYSKADADSRFLNVSGEASDVSITGDLTVDTDTFVVDGTNDLIGIGTASPASHNAGGVAVQIDGGANASELRLTNTTTGAASGNGFHLATVGNKAYIVQNESDDLYIYANGNEILRFNSSNQAVFGASADRQVLIGATDNTNATDATLILENNTQASTHGKLFIASGTTTPGANLGLGFVGFGDANKVPSAFMGVYADGGWTSGSDMPTRMAFWTTADGASSATERVRISNDGNVTIGDSSNLGRKLSVVGDSYITAGYLEFGGSISPTPTSANPLIYRNNPGTGPNMVFTNNAAEAMRIDQGQRLLIGVDAHRSSFFGNNVGTYRPLFQVEGVNTSSGERMISFVHNDDSNNGFIQIFGRSRGTTANSLTAVDADDNLGVISWQGGTGTTLTEAAQIKAEVDGAVGAADMPGRLVFRTTADGNSSSSERMRINNAGDVKIGSGDPTERLHVDGEVRVEGQLGANLYVRDEPRSVSPTNIGSSIGLKMQVADRNGNASWAGVYAKGSDAFQQGNSLYFITQSTTGSEPDFTNGNIPSDVRMAIDRYGTLTIPYGAANENASSGTGLTMHSSGYFISTRTAGSANLYINKAGTTGEMVRFLASGADVGSIDITGSSTSYNTSSDYRLKENVVDLTGATERLKQLEPKRFNFIADADTTVDGFLAHEVQDIVPEAITGTKDEVDADGNPVYQGIDQSKLVPLLVATIKELEARITALEAS